MGRAGARFGGKAQPEQEPAVGDRPEPAPGGVEADPATGVGRTGARFGGSRHGSHAAEPRHGATPAGPLFETALRGYERAAVDAHLAGQRESAEAMRAALADAERRERFAVERAESVEAENAELRAAVAAHVPADTGFGSRAERILRMAEQEAADARARAVAESTALLDAARSDAERHRHDVEQELIARVSRADQAAAQLQTELAERQEQMGRRHEAEREETHRMHAAAVRSVEVLCAAAEAEVEEIRLTARADVERMRELSRQDLARLNGMRSDVRSELGRLVRVLEAQSGAAQSGAAQAGPAQAGPAQAGPAQAGAGHAGSSAAHPGPDAADRLAGVRP